MIVAITREPAQSLGECELTYVGRQPIDTERAASQHGEYRRALAACGARVVVLPAVEALPDSVFVEDTAVVLDELAVIARPGAESRRGETASVAAALGEHRELACIRAPGTLDGGDVLKIGDTVFVGRGGRTNDEGIRQLAAHLPGATVVPVPVTRVLH
nr:arginine deiminase family protein [Acidobacteriota bacterium]